MDLYCYFYMDVTINIRGLVTSYPFCMMNDNENIFIIKSLATAIAIQCELYSRECIRKIKKDIAENGSQHLNGSVHPHEQTNVSSNPLNASENNTTNSQYLTSSQQNNSQQITSNVTVQNNNNPVSVYVVQPNQQRSQQDLISMYLNQLPPEEHQVYRKFAIDIKPKIEALLRDRKESEEKLMAMIFQKWNKVPEEKKKKYVAVYYAKKREAERKESQSLVKREQDVQVQNETRVENRFDHILMRTSQQHQQETKDSAKMQEQN